MEIQSWPAGNGEWIYDGVFTRFKERKQKQIWLNYVHIYVLLLLGWFLPILPFGVVA